MSTQPLSQEFEPVRPRLLKELPIVNGKNKKKGKTAKRTTEVSKKLRAKSKVVSRKLRTEEVAAPEADAQQIQETIEPKQALSQPSLAIIENLPATNGDFTNYPSPEPFAQAWREEDSPVNPCILPTEDLPLANDSAIEVHAANQPAAVPMPEVAVESADLTEQITASVAETGAVATFYKPVLSALAQLWNMIRKKFNSQQSRKRLRVCETVSLGEKRFLAVIQVDGQEFLVGGSSTSVSTLAQLDPNRDFTDALRSCERELSHA